MSNFDVTAISADKEHLTQFGYLAFYIKHRLRTKTNCALQMHKNLYFLSFKMQMMYICKK